MVKNSLKVLPPKAPQIVVSVNNLALTYLRQNKAREAEKILKQGLRALNEVLGQENFHTLFSMSNIATAYH